MSFYFINESDFFGIILNGFTTNITGDISLSLLSVFILLLVFALSFSIPAEYTLPILLPIALLFAAFSTSLFFIAGIMIFMLAGMLVRMWFI